MLRPKSKKGHHLRYSQIYGPVNHVKEEEGEGEEGSGVQVNFFGSRRDDWFWRRNLLVVLGLRFARTSTGINRLPVAVKV